MRYSQLHPIWQVQSDQHRKYCHSSVVKLHFSQWTFNFSSDFSRSFSFYTLRVSLQAAEKSLKLLLSHNSLSRFYTVWFLAQTSWIIVIRYNTIIIMKIRTARNLYIRFSPNWSLFTFHKILIHLILLTILWVQSYSITILLNFFCLMFSTCSISSGTATGWAPEEADSETEVTMQKVF